MPDNVLDDDTVLLAELYGVETRDWESEKREAARRILAARRGKVHNQDHRLQVLYTVWTGGGYQIVLLLIAYWVFLQLPSWYSAFRGADSIMAGFR